MTDVQFRPQFLKDRTEGEDIAGRVLGWWARLLGERSFLDAERDLPRAARPALRRCGSTDDALLTEGFRALWLSLPDEWRRPWDLPAWACAASVLAEVKKHDPARTFARAMGKESRSEGGSGSGKPIVSELRFQQLLRSQDLDELLRRARRAVHLLGRSVDVVSLADDILHWHREKGGQVAWRPEDRLAVRWANDYFTEIAKYSK